ncbi:acid protease [Obba rivulosa]|uniref:Acid protease n=1 Tax=Obba rivulosa TaxID=1052685 RepID=A0A8E2B125_9APHY|nr:acid protease [Obba rivulosa]
MFCHVLYLVLVPFCGVLSQADGIHLPLHGSKVQSATRRDGLRTAIGLGDVLDVTYSVLVQVGSTQTPLVLDTGSSDLWLVSDTCTPNCTNVGVPLYSQASLHSTGLEVHLLYGDSRTGTQAVGPIGIDSAGISGLSVPEQNFAAITNTNTTVLDTGAAGILGLGFPPISVIWRQLIAAELASYNTTLSSKHARSHPSVAHMAASPMDRGSRRLDFPSFDFISALARAQHRRELNQTSSISAAAAAIAGFTSYGPLVTRFISQHVLGLPLVAITLQRDTLAPGGNAGVLSLGALPPGVDASQLTWVPVRGYNPSQGGLPPSPAAPNEVYPLVWEIPVDDVYFDGMKLPRSTISDTSISLSALLDTGNSLIRGPQDVIAKIFSQLGSSDSTPPSIDCGTPHNLSFQIGGSLFPVDPRDFVHIDLTDTLASDGKVFCTPALAVTDPPGNGSFLYSWSLGDPFLKSVLTALYYGNLTHPSRDPPRVGLLSSVPQDADDGLRQAVAQAEADGGFPLKSDPAPTGTFLATMTGIGGVPQATQYIQQSSAARSTASFSMAQIPGELLLLTGITLGVLATLI